MVAKQQESDPVIIKKYANRRLYSTSTSSYVTLERLREMVKEGVEFIVYEAKSNEDITRSVLTQIIVDEESKGGQNLLPLSFLRQLISYYGDGLQQSVLPNYLGLAMDNFSQNQEKVQNYMSENLNTVFPFGNLEEIGRQNMAMFEQAMKMFSTFSVDASGTDGKSAPETQSSHKEAPFVEGPSAPARAIATAADTKQALSDTSPVDMLTDLQKQLAEMQKKIADMDKN